MSCTNPDYFGLGLMIFIGIVGVIALVGFAHSTWQVSKPIK